MTWEKHFSPLFVYFDHFFTTDEIDKIKEIGLSKPLEEAYINSGGKESELKLQNYSRTCTLNWIDQKEEYNWLFHKLTEAFVAINDKYFNFDIEKFEPLQFARYDSSRQEFYGKHIDCSRGSMDHSTTRKLSVTLQLSDESEYEGGDLLLHASDKPDIAPKKKGMMIVFPSTVLHEVTPVKKGTRYSLVTWAHGPLFR